MNGFIKFQDTIQPEATAGEKTAVAAVGAVDELGLAGEPGECAQGEQPEVGQCDYQHEPGNALDRDWGQSTAAGVIMMLPVILFSLFTHRYLIGGLTAGAVKE